MGKTIRVDTEAKRIILRNVTYYTRNHQYSKADIVVEGRRIAELLPCNSLRTNEGMDASEYVVLPGLINSHLHPSKELYRGDLAYCETTKILRAVHANDRTEDSETQSAAGYYSLLRAIRNGVTTVGIFTSRAEVDASQARRSGIRAVVHYAQNDQWLGVDSGPRESSISEIFKRYDSCVQKYESDLIRVDPATASELSGSVEMIRFFHRVAKKTKRKFGMHICEGKNNVEHCISYHGRNGIQLLKKLKMLDSNILLIHACWLDEEDVSALHAGKVSLVHCPVSNSFTGAGKFPYKTLCVKNVGLGTDAAMVNPFNDLAFDAACSLYFHGDSCLEEKVTSDEIVKSLTSKGAEALGISGLGSIQEGMLADLCCYRASELMLGWKDKGLSFLATVLHSKPVHVIINGRFIIYDNNFINCSIGRAKEQLINCIR